jgi:AraC-like DNA-binding protein
LEHKEVWQSFVVLGIILLVYAIYSLDAGELIYEYAMEVVNIVLICYLLWRVETLNDLSIPVQRARSISPAEKFSLSQNIGPLLKKYCEEPQLYLQHDLTLLQLAKAIGINRSYLSKHFAMQGFTYNAYINGLRIQHFINLYHEAAATHQPVTAQQLAYQSGFRNYNTFSAAFKQKMGMNPTEWMPLVKS